MTFNAYHFTGDKLRDGRPIPAIGETLVHDDPIEWCKSGLYASRHPFDAVKHAPGPILHRVLCEDIEQEVADKFVCRRRTIVASIDASNLLHQFTKDCALDTIQLRGVPDAVSQYLKTSAAAQDAALAAAYAASAAALAAYDVAAYTASSARFGGAWAAARAAAFQKQRERFAAMVDAAFLAATDALKT